MLQIPNQQVPLAENEHGVLRIAGTRVSLDSVIAVFEQGYTPEQIVHSFPTLKLPDVYAVITYYLNHRDEVNAYLAEQGKQAEDLRRELEEFSPPNDLRERLLRRHNDKSE